MKVTATFLFSLLLGCALSSLQAQNAVEVSPPALSLKGGMVHIEYQLLNVSKTDKFNVRIEVTSQSGHRLPARSLSGDIGKGITGAGNKRIVWDIEADSIFLDEEIYVEIFALFETPPAQPVTTVEEEVLEEPVITEKPEEAAAQALDKSKQKELYRTSLIIQSIAFPGLGLSRLNPGQPHWIRGVAAYGCLSTSIYLNRKSWSVYQEYLDSEDPNQVDDLYDEAYNTKKTSRILGYAALGVWVIDLAWTIIGTSDLNKDQLSEFHKGFSIGTSVESMSNVPLIAFRYRF